MNIRRKLVIALGAGALAVPCALLAQQTGKAHRVGILGWETPESRGENLALLVARLAELGWKDDVNIKLDVTWARSDPARFREHAVALAARKPALVVVWRDTDAVIALPLMGATPILFAIGLDPVGLGLVKSLARPGGSVTGISFQNRALSGKKLGLLKEAVPKLTRVGALYRNGDANALHWAEETAEQGKAHGILVIPVPIARREDLAPAFESMAKQGVGAVLNIPDVLFFQTRQELADLSLKHRLASIGGISQLADAGSLLSYGPEISIAWKNLAGFADRVLKGARPADMPVEQLNVFEMVVNLKTARALKLQLPLSLILQATRVIE